MTYATIDGFEQLTPQQVFDISKNHLLTKNEKSMVQDEGAAAGIKICAYRGENSKMCAAGPFLKDEEASKCEGNDWYHLRYRSHKVKVPAAHYDLVVALQEVHDYNDPPSWENALESVAKDFNLVY